MCCLQALRSQTGRNQKVDGVAGPNLGFLCPLRLNNIQRQSLEEIESQLQSSAGREEKPIGSWLKNNAPHEGSRGFHEKRARSGW